MEAENRGRRREENVGAYRLLDLRDCVSDIDFQTD